MVSQQLLVYRLWKTRSRSNRGAKEQEKEQEKERGQETLALDNIETARIQLFLRLSTHPTHPTHPYVIPGGQLHALAAIHTKNNNISINRLDKIESYRIIDIANKPLSTLE